MKQIMQIRLVEIIIGAILDYSAAKFKNNFPVKLLRRFWAHHERWIRANPLLYLPDENLLDSLRMPSDPIFAECRRNWKTLKTQLTPAEKDIHQKLVISFAGGKGVAMATWQADCIPITTEKLFKSLVEAKLISQEDVEKLRLRTCYVSSIIDMGTRYVIWFDLVFNRPTAEAIAKTFRCAFEKYGIPLSLRFDRGGEYKNKLLKKIFHELGIEVRHNKVRSPKQNCIVENFQGGILRIWANHIWTDYLSKWRKYNGNLSASLLRDSLAKAKATRNNQNFYRSPENPTYYFTAFPSQKVRDLWPGEAERLFFTANKVQVRSGRIRFYNKYHWNSKFVGLKKCMVYREITTEFRDRFFVTTTGGQILCQLRIP